MTDEVRVYINERGVSVPRGSTALDSVRALLPHEADMIAAGQSMLQDSRGLPVQADVPVSGGAIFRIVPVRRRSESDA